MSKLKLLLIGAGGHARSCIDVIEQEGKFQISGLIGLDKEVGTFVNGYEVIGTDADLTKLANKISYSLITVGQIASPELRIKLHEKTIGLGFTAVKISSPTAYISPTAQIGIGTIIMHGAIVNSKVKIGNNCIINSRTLLEHDTQVSDNCHISTGAVLNGGVYVGEGCFIGSGSLVKECVSIGPHSVIGIGSVVRNNLENKSFVKGEFTK